MSNFNKNNIIFISLLSFLIFSSCKDSVLPQPNIPDSIVNAEISAPKNLFASQGLKRKITLTWDSIPNAVRYYIYYSPTQFSSFKKIAITDTVTQNNLQNSYSLSVTSGTYSFYRVSAEDSYGAESTLSDIVYGSSLASPFISFIDDSIESKSIVYWYMPNVSSETYMNNLQYIVTCTSTDGKENLTLTIPGFSIIDGIKVPTENVTFENLRSNTEYTYSVEAFLNSTQSDFEISEKVNSETARRLCPEAPIDLSISKGVTPLGITLSFILPTQVDVLIEKNTFEYHNVFFRIYRRPYIEGNTSNDDWEKIIDYLGCNIEKATEAGTIPLGSGIYTPGESVSWTDLYTDEANSIQRGIKYEYRVQSFTDDVKTDVSSSKSITTDIGWAMNLPIFEIKSVNTQKNDDNEIQNTSVKFNISWNNFESEKNYYFVIQEKHNKFKIDNSNIEDTEGTKSILSDEGNNYFITQDIINGESGNGYEKVYNLSTSDKISIRGYYSYTVYIIESSKINNLEEAILSSPVSASTAGRLTITNISYVLEDFQIEQGYKDKFVLSWKYNSNYKYTICYTPIVNGEVKSEIIIESSTEQIESLHLTDGETVTYTDNVQSGDIRIYSVYVEAESMPPSCFVSNEVRTLGTPKLNFDINTKSYKDIKVTWKPVSMANEYRIKIDDNSEINIDETYLVDSVEGNYYSYTFENIECKEGIIDATKAGQKHKVQLTAIGNLDDTINKKSDSSYSSIDYTLTLGPSCLNTAVSKAISSDTIFVSWDKIDSAKVYVIQRQRFSITTIGTHILSSVEQYRVSGKSPESGIIFNGDKLNCNSMSVTYDESTKKYLLTDKYEEQTDLYSQHEKSQSMIPWGIPYSYTIIPLISESDEYEYTVIQKDGLDIVDTAIIRTSNSDTVSYSNISDPSICIKGSTIGYGQNIIADKAESSSSITVKWNKPYFVSPGMYPVVYYRVQNSNNMWNIMYPQNKGDTSYSFTTLDPTNTDVFEFAIEYYLSEDNINIQNREFVPSYLKELSTKITEGNEADNIGYLFSLLNFSTRNISDNDGNEGYSEELSWTLWNYDKRKNGPSSYEISSMNKNNSSTYFPIAKITGDGKELIILDNNNGGRDWYNCTFSTNTGNNNLIITPKELTNGSYEGLLKVQRDYIHYYKIVATKTNKEGNIITTTLLSESYRRITPEEFVKNSLLVVADSIHQNGGEGKTLNGKQGTLTTKFTYNINISYDFVFKYNSYIHNFSTLPGSSQEQPSYLTLNMAKDSPNGRANSNKIYYFNNPEIYISGPLNLKSYSGLITFTAGVDKKSTSYYLNILFTQGTVTEPLNTGTIEIKNNQNDFYNYFPFYLGQDLKGTDDTAMRTSYNELYPCCQNNWWEVKE